MWKEKGAGPAPQGSAGLGQDGGSRLGRGESEAGRKRQDREVPCSGLGAKLWGCLSICPPPAITAASLTFGAGTSVGPSPSLWPRLPSSPPGSTGTWC